MTSLNSIFCYNNSRSVISGLDLGYNLITDLSNDSFDNVYSLNYLNLENNNISLLPPGIFSKLSDLRMLNLSNNHLKDFQHGVFEHMPNLQQLDLSGNDLTNTRRYFHSLRNLKKLYLINNHFDNLNSSQLMLDLPHLRTISLEGNNIFCDDLINIIQNFRRKWITVTKGNVNYTANIHGIACKDFKNATTSTSGDLNNKEQHIFVEIENLLQKYEYTSNFMYDFFNNAFEKSNFYQYFEQSKLYQLRKFNETEFVNYFETDFKNLTFFKYFENFHHSLISNSSFIDYFSTGFINSSFIRYSETLKDMNRFMFDSFNKSVFYNFFHHNFHPTHSYKYFDNHIRGGIFENQKQNQTAKVDKLRNISNRNNYFGIIGFLIVLQTLLLVTLSVSAFMLFKMYYVLVKKNNNEIM